MAMRSLIPTLLGRDWWDTWDYPARIMDQSFALPLIEDDLLAPRVYRGFMIRPRTQANVEASGQSEVKNDGKQLEIMLNVSHFKPEEIQLKVVDNFIEIHAKHEEKVDEHGFVSREFTRRYMLPNNCDIDAVSSSLNPQGVLVIRAPKKALEEKPRQERMVPIANEEENNK